MGNIIKILNDIKDGINSLTNYSFEVIIGICILFLILFSIYRRYRGEKGSWSTKYFYEENNVSDNKITNRVRTDSKGELECRRVLEQIFHKPFNKSRPNFLNNPITGGNFNLELDCYNEDLRIAVEYDGEAHAKYIPYFHKNKEAFYNQKYRDYMKDTMCRDNGIFLIRVPHTVKVENIDRFIKDKLKKN